MAWSLTKVRYVAKSLGFSGSSSSSSSSSSSLFSASKSLFGLGGASSSSYRSYASAKAAMKEKQGGVVVTETPELDEVIPTSGISRPLSEILKELNKRVPDSVIRVRTEADGFPIKYIPWFFWTSYKSLELLQSLINSLLKSLLKLKFE